MAVLLNCSTIAFTCCLVSSGMPALLIAYLSAMVISSTRRGANALEREHVAVMIVQCRNEAVALWTEAAARLDRVVFYSLSCFISLRTDSNVTYLESVFQPGDRFPFRSELLPDTAVVAGLCDGAHDDRIVEFVVLVQLMSPRPSCRMEVA